MGEGFVTAFDPVAPASLAESIGRALESSEAGGLDDVNTKIRGPGVYALYYIGDSPLYTPLAELNREAVRAGLGPIAPIYVGKAVPRGGRSRSVELKDLEAFGGEPALAKRLIEHRESISLVKNLREEDFLVRGVLLAPVWISLGESLLIQYYKPVWNLVVTGFGNHDPGKKGRGNQRKSAWDTLHPGRTETWSAKLRPSKKSAEEIKADLEKHWRGWRDRVVENLPWERRRLLEGPP